MATPSDTGPQPQAPDLQQITQSFAQIAERSQKLVNEYLERQREGKTPAVSDDLGLTHAFMDLGAALLANPWKLAEVQMQMWQDYFRLWQGAMQRFLGEQAAPVAEPAKSDTRFKSEVWENNFVFDYIKQSYLIASQNIQRMVADVQGLDAQTARKVRFFTRQFVDALAPTNFVFTNPDVLKATVETGGKNLVDGLQNLLGDLERGGGQLAISMTDYKAFKLGENVATTPGKVVFQNNLMQLIQYTPSTAEVWRTPLLIVPPWINKYYILDLREKNSFIRWAVAQGHTVFVVSWVNPDERFAHKTFDDYMLEGPLAALDAIEQATGEHEANVIGYCLGGTLLAATLAWLAAAGERRVKSATFFTALIDFTEPGELGVFVDETTLASLEKKMQERGYLEGAEMANTFNLLRANDLIWSFVVNNYLLGKDPFPFDLLYWNSDATRMPAKMHTFYLRRMYIENLLARPGGISLAGRPIDVAKITTPACFVSTLEDHIAPWKSTYTGARLLAGPVKFLLAGSGHIAGVVNPPAAHKYCHWTNTELPASADEWLAGAQRDEGSWWPEWNGWVRSFGGDKVPARTPGDGKLAAIEDAPGSYVKLRLDASGTAADPPVSDLKPAAASAVSADHPARQRAARPKN
ncbi:MAG TPA: class I poly(R)-hydroxyalkanoic acid synthase [Burkholderiales bacterium]|nr:class I poly(R)-hydroxyalkanoic acid synthase [Burkholderiales bacterium]